MNFVNNLIDTLEQNKILRFIVRYFQGELYLCGSALHFDKPRDIDLRLIISKENFDNFFLNSENWVKQGQSGEWKVERYIWARICVLITSILSWDLGLNIDFEIYPQIEKYKVDGVLIMKKINSKGEEETVKEIIKEVLDEL